MAADGPWRCSQCGTINEPVANSCRTCGRWPSLFDLQESVVDEMSGHTATATAEPEVGTFEPQPFRPETYRTETYQPEAFEPETFEVDEMPADEQPAETSGERRRRVITSLLVPLAFVVYIVISIVFGDRGSG